MLVQGLLRKPPSCVMVPAEQLSPAAFTLQLLEQYRGQCLLLIVRKAACFVERFLK